MGIVASFLILSFYIVVAGWSMDYTVKHLVDFGKPVREQAVAQSMAYEAVASTDSMRADLVDARASRIAARRIDVLEAGVSPGTLALHAEFVAAMSATDDADVSADVRRARLRSDPEVRNAVDAVEAMAPAMAEARSAAAAEAKAEFDTRFSGCLTI